MRTASSLALALALAVGCGDDDASPDPDLGAFSDAGSSSRDASAPVDAPAPDTWASFAMGFMATYCVECHDGPPRDYRTIDEVRRDRDTIACGVSLEARDGCGSFPSPGQFPVGSGPRPSDAERARLVAWIDAGLPE